MKPRFVAAFDAGTSGIKAVLADLDGCIQATATVGYDLIVPHKGWAEQNPEQYWTAACRAAQSAMQRISASPEQVIGISFATQWKGMIPLDHAGHVLRNSIIWLDLRAERQAAELTQRLGRRFTPRDYWTRVMWYRDNEPELFEQTACILEANGYLKYRACGNGPSDISNHFTRSTDPRVQRFFDSVLEAACLDASLFPALTLPTDEVGRLTKQAASEMGFSPGTPVFGGLCDIPAVAAGAGAYARHAAHLYLGSSGWFGITQDASEVTDMACPVMLTPDRWLRVSGLQSACMTYEWCLNTWYSRERAELGDGIHAYAAQEMASVPPGSQGLLGIPSLYGEAGPFLPDMRAGFIGLTAEHKRRHMVNAMLEGLSYMLRFRKGNVERAAGCVSESVCAVGGGALNAHWMQILASVLHARIEVPANARHAGAAGSAYCALIGLGVCRDFGDCAARIRPEAVYEPVRETVEIYDGCYNIFLQAVLPSFEAGRVQTAVENRSQE